MGSSTQGTSPRSPYAPAQFVYTARRPARPACARRHRTPVPVLAAPRGSATAAARCSMHRRSERTTARAAPLPLPNPMRAAGTRARRRSPQRAPASRRAAERRRTGIPRGRAALARARAQLLSARSIGRDAPLPRPIPARVAGTHAWRRNPNARASRGAAAWSRTDYRTRERRGPIGRATLVCAPSLAAPRARRPEPR